MPYNLIPTPHLWPIPHEINFGNEEFFFSTTTIYLFAPQKPKDIVFAETEKSGFTAKYISDNKFRISLTKNNDIDSERADYIGSQGYILNINEFDISVIANSESGLLYALQTLNQLGSCNGGFQSIHIVDKPNVLNRGVMIDLARVVERSDYIISLLPFLASCRINQIYFNIENKLQYSSHPELAHPMAWSQDAMLQVIDEAAKYFIEVIPIPSTIGHMESILKHEEYSHLAEPNTADHLAIYKPKPRKFITQLLEELCQLFPGECIHLAGDETPYLAYSLCVDENIGKEQLIKAYAEGVNFMAGIVRKHGKKAMIWADMASHYPELLQLIDKDVILIDWHYGRLDTAELKSPEKFMGSGFEVGVAGGILADEPFLPILDRLERNLPYLYRRSGLWGTIGCMWEPRTQTLPVAKIGMAIAGACSWNPFAIDIKTLLSDASQFVYKEDISDAYKLLATGDFFDRMMETKMSYYHPFEFSCSHPAIHLSEADTPWWQKLHTRISQGLKLLEQKSNFAGNYPVDYNAIKACGMLAKCLAGWVVKMQSARMHPNAIAELKQLVQIMKETLKMQSDAWRATRFIEDNNFNWWFADPFDYKIRCLQHFIKELETGQKIKLDSLIFSVNKGNSASWNLLRLKILFSDNRQQWKQMFFRTIPLWMAEDVSFELMPAERLPKWVKIQFSGWTWHDRKTDWQDRVSLTVITRKLKNLEASTNQNMYKAVESEANSLLFELTNENSTV